MNPTTYTGSVSLIQPAASASHIYLEFFKGDINKQTAGSYLTFELVPDVVYMMTLKCQAQSNTATYGPLHLQTVSSNEIADYKNHIIYDENPVFGIIHYGPLPAPVTVTISRKESPALDKVNEVFTAVITISEIPKIHEDYIMQIEWIDPSYKWQGVETYQLLQWGPTDVDRDPATT